MAFCLRTRNHTAIPLSLAFSIAALVCSCSFPSLGSSTPTTDVNSETPAAAPDNTPSVSTPDLSGSSSTTMPPTLPPADQEQLTVDRADETALGGSVDQKFAQVFTVSQSGYISHIALPLNCQSTAWITLRIVDASGGVPGGAVLATQVVSGSELTLFRDGSITSFSVIALEGAPSVSAGAMYAFTLETYAGDCNLLWGPPGDTYSDGRAFFEVSDNPPGWREISNPERDLAFQIYISSSVPAQ